MDLTIPPPNDACEPCSIANIKVEQHKRHVESGRWENDLIHSDIQGPFRLPVDDHLLGRLDPQICCVLSAKQGRPTVLGAFKSFLNQVEHGDCKCTRFRTDCSTEYDNYEMYAFRLVKGFTW